jgi:hypothetical protein
VDKLLLFEKRRPAASHARKSCALASFGVPTRLCVLPRDQLELLEDKLREYRALDDHQQEDKVRRHPPPGTVHLRCSPCGYPVQALTTC